MTLDAAHTDYLTSHSRGRLATIAAQEHLSSHLIRIHPRRIVSWNIDPAHPGLQTHDLGHNQ